MSVICAPVGMASPEDDYTKAKAHIKAKEMPEALDLLLRAAEEGHAKAQDTYAGLIMETGGSKEDMSKAFQLRLQAAKQGYRPAMMNLSVHYSRGTVCLHTPFCRLLIWRVPRL